MDSWEETGWGGGEGGLFCNISRDMGCWPAAARQGCNGRLIAGLRDCVFEATCVLRYAKSSLTLFLLRYLRRDRQFQNMIRVQEGGYCSACCCGSRRGIAAVCAVS